MNKMNLSNRPGIDYHTFNMLIKAGINPSQLATSPDVPTAGMPISSFGVPGMKAYFAREMNGTNVGGMVFGNPSKDTTTGIAALAPDTMFLSSGLRDKPSQLQNAYAHETEHLMAKRGLGRATAINTRFDEQVNAGAAPTTGARAAFVNAAVAAYPYLKEKYGMTSGYFTPKMVALQGSRAPNLLYEQLAELSAIEQTQGVDLTKDPVLRKTLFKDKAVRETYNALTGLRQTRLDSKDLPPHTRQPEQGSGGVIDTLKRLFNFANGGYVPEAKNTRFI